MKQCTNNNCDYFDLEGECSSVCIKNGIKKFYVCDEKEMPCALASKHGICVAHQCCIEPRLKTNGDRVREMTDEELVKFYHSPRHCKEEEPTECKKTGFVNGLSPCEQCFLEWLKQPV